MATFFVGMRTLISFVICLEPRGGSQDDFEHVLKGYYDTIRRSKKPALGRKRRVKKLDLNNSDRMDGAGISKDGAAFLAVCRGKVYLSETIASSVSSYASLVQAPSLIYTKV